MLSIFMISIFKQEASYINLLKYLVIIILFLPLVPVAPFLINVEFIIAHVFKILVEVMLIVYIGLLIFNFAKYKPRTSGITMALLLWIVALIISNFTSADWYRSFWGEINRFGGVFMFLHFGIFFLITTAVFNKQENWLRFFYLSIIASFINTILALGQHFSLWNEKLLYQADRSMGTIGNPAFFATYILLHIFLIVVLLNSDFLNSKRKRLLYIIFIAELYVLFLTATRGAFVGLVFGFLIIIFLRNNIKLSKKILYAVSGIFIIGLIILGLIQLYPSKNIERLFNYKLTDITIRNRLIFNEITFRGFNEKPLLGWGEENFYLVSDKYYDPILYNHKANEAVVDRPHNFLLERLANGGIIGLLAYLLIWITILLKLRWLKKNNIIKPDASAIWYGLLGGYFAQNLFLFDTITSYIVFFLILGYINSIGIKNIITEERKNNVIKTVLIKLPFNASVFIVTITLIACFYIIWFVNIKTIIGSDYIRRLQAEATGKDIIFKMKTSLKYYNKLVDLNPVQGHLLRWRITQMIGDSMNIHLKKIPISARPFVINIYEQIVLKELDILYNQNSANYWASYNMGITYSMLSRFDKKYSEDARSKLHLASKIAPRRQETYWALLDTYNTTKNNAEILNTSKKLIELNPKSALNRLNMSFVYMLFNSLEEAKQELTLYNQYKTGSNVEDFIYIIQNYTNNPHYTESMLLANLMLDSTQDKQNRALLFNQIALIQYKTNKFKEAKQTLLKNINEYPDIKNDPVFTGLVIEIFKIENRKFIK